VAEWEELRCGETHEVCNPAVRVVPQYNYEVT